MSANDAVCERNYFVLLLYSQILSLLLHCTQQESMPRLLYKTYSCATILLLHNYVLELYLTVTYLANVKDCCFLRSMKDQGLLGQCLCFIKKCLFSLLSVISSFMNLSLQMKHFAGYKFITLQKNPNSRKLSEQKLFFFVFVVTLVLLIMK